MSRILRFPEVVAMVGLAQRTIASKVANGEFPAPVKLGARAVGWPEMQIAEWLQSRVVSQKGGRE